MKTMAITQINIHIHKNLGTMGRRGKEHVSIFNPSVNPQVPFLLFAGGSRGGGASKLKFLCKAY